jgi:hypothetical protein
MRDDTGNEVGFDWPMLDAGNFDLVTATWVNVLLSISPTSILTFEDGVPVPDADYEFYSSMGRADANLAFPRPSELNSMWGPMTSNEIHVGGRADHADERQFLGNIALLTVYGVALSGTEALCNFEMGEGSLMGVEIDDGMDDTVSGCPGDETSLNVIVHTGGHAEDVTLQIDAGATMGVNPQFADDTVYVETVCLPTGTHTLSYFDSYGDGWSGGYWELQSTDGETIMGGEVDGVVTGFGGESEFTLGATGGVLVSTEDTVTVVIHTGDMYAEEISWDIDGGQSYPPTGFGGIAVPYESSSEYAEEINLPEGQHTFYFYDAYGDGWSGGYYEILDSAGASIAGGDPAGVVQNLGGEAAFCVICCDAPCSAGESNQAAASVQIGVEVPIHTR